MNWLADDTKAVLSTAAAYYFQIRRQTGNWLCYKIQQADFLLKTALTPQ